MKIKKLKKSVRKALKEALIITVMTFALFVGGIAVMTEAHYQTLDRQMAEVK